MNPLVSCLCPTYDRLDLLAESLYWFTQQTYPFRELVILNQCPQQTIICDVPGVRVANVGPARTLGHARQLLCKAAHGVILCPWDDDDISLPDRLTQAVNVLEQGYDYFNPLAYWFQSNGELHHTHAVQVGQTASAFRFHLAECYEDITVGEDAIFDATARRHYSSKVGGTPIHEWQYIYRWGVTEHISGYGNAMQSHWCTRLPSRQGVIRLTPRMGRDYAAEVDTIVKGLKNVPQ